MAGLSYHITLCLRFLFRLGVGAEQLPIIPRFKGATGAGSLPRCFCVEHEAACFRASAAIAPGQEPELHDAGVSGNAGKGSHLAEVKAAESSAGQVDGLGSSRNAGIGSHLAGVGAA